MQKNGAKLTVFFEEPFWVGLYQRWSGPKLEVAKITFGAEPKDGEVYQFLLEHWKRLSFSPKELSARPGTKSQQALALQREAAKASCQEDARQRKERERQEKFQIRQRKRKEKHRGR